MNPETTLRDLLYPAEWTFRFAILAVLIYIASPDWTFAFPVLANSLISPLTYCLFTLAAAGAFVVQIWVALKFISARRQNDVPQHQ